MENLKHIHMMNCEVVKLQKTDHLNLDIPEKTDKFNVDDFNNNFIVIDAVIKEIAEKFRGV